MDATVGDLTRQARYLLTEESITAAGNLIDQADRTLEGPVTDLHADVWYVQGMVYEAASEICRPIQIFERILRHAGAYPSRIAVMQGHVHIQLGLLYRRRGDDLISFSHFRQAAAWAEQEGVRSIRIEALHNLAWMCCQDKNPGAAHRLLDEAEPLILAVVDRSFQEVYRSYALVLGGRCADALAMLDEVVNRLDWRLAAHAPAMAMCQYVAGIACLRSGLTKEAVAFCLDAERRVAGITDSRLRNMACQLQSMSFTIRQAEGVQG